MSKDGVELHALGHAHGHYSGNWQLSCNIARPFDDSHKRHLPTGQSVGLAQVSQASRHAALLPLLDRGQRLLSRIATLPVRDQPGALQQTKGLSERCVALRNLQRQPSRVPSQFEDRIFSWSIANNRAGVPSNTVPAGSGATDTAPPVLSPVATGRPTAANKSTAARSTRSFGATKRLTPPVSRASKVRKRSWLAAPIPRHESRIPSARARDRISSVAKTWPSVRINTSPAPARTPAAFSNPFASSVPPHASMLSRNFLAPERFSSVPASRTSVMHSSLSLKATSAKRSSADSAAKHAAMAFLACVIGAPCIEPDRSRRIATRRGEFGVFPKAVEGTIAANADLPSSMGPANTWADCSRNSTSRTRSRSGTSRSGASKTVAGPSSSSCTLTA